MKKLLKNFAILTVFACGLFTGCNNDAEIDLNVNVTVSTDTPSLDEPKNLGYGVLLTWGITQDANCFRVTRQENGGEEKILGEIEEHRFFDKMGFSNELKEGVEYTYRVYNLGDKTNHNYEDDNDSKGSWYYGDNCVVKTSCAEKKITLTAGNLKKQGEKLEAVNKDNVTTSFKNGRLRIYLNDENSAWYSYCVVKDAETGKKVVDCERRWDEDCYYANDIPVQKVNVEIINADYTGYYEASEAVTIENIENTNNVEEGVYIQNLKKTVSGKTVVLHWSTTKKVEANEFAILRSIKDDYNYSKAEVLKITPTYEETNNGTYYWTVIDETVEVGTDYEYRVMTDSDYECVSAYVPGDYLDPSISLNVSMYYISSKTDEVLLSFNGDKNITYKGYWTTVDNKGNESARTEFKFTEDNDNHYRKTFKASDIANLDKSVSVNFYVKCYDGDKLLGHAVGSYRDENNNEVYIYEYEYKETVYVSPSLTTYTSLSGIEPVQTYDYQTYSYKNEITIDFYGYNLDNAIKATYFKNNGGEIKDLTLTKVSTSHYTVKLTDLDAGEYYTICATIPKDNAYNVYDLSETRQLYVEWYY